MKGSRLATTTSLAAPRRLRATSSRRSLVQDIDRSFRCSDPPNHREEAEPLEQAPCSAGKAYCRANPPHLYRHARRVPSGAFGLTISTGRIAERERSVTQALAQPMARRLQ